MRPRADLQIAIDISRKSSLQSSLPGFCTVAFHVTRQRYSLRDTRTNGLKYLHFALFDNSKKQGITFAGGRTIVTATGNSIGQNGRYP